MAYLGDQLTPVNSEEQAVEALIESEKAMCMAVKRRQLALLEFPSDPVLQHPRAIGNYSELGGETWGQRSFWTSAFWAMTIEGERIDSPARQQLHLIATTSECPTARDLATTLLDVHLKAAASVVTNPSFEDGSGGSASGWILWNKPEPLTGVQPPGSRIVRSDAMSRTGTRSLLCEAMYRGGPHQTLNNVDPGEYMATVWAYVTEESAPTGTLELTLSLFDSNGNRIPDTKFSYFLTPERGVWNHLVVQASIPLEIAQEGVNLMIIPIVNGYQTGGQVYWDDLSLYQRR